ncbi:MAG: hypothetical protein ACRDPG_09635 [Nocardioidaceae bacterium]
MSTPRSWTRRAFLGRAGAAATLGYAVLTGCTISESAPTPPTRPAAATSPTVSDADVALLAAAIRDEQRLLLLCEEVEQGSPHLYQMVSPLIRVQRVHVRALRQAMRPPPRQIGSSSSPLPVPRSGSAAATLARRFSDAQADRLTDCLAADSGLLARLLASVAASHAADAQTLAPSR